MVRVSELVGILFNTAKETSSDALKSLWIEGAVQTVSYIGYSLAFSHRVKY